MENNQSKQKPLSLRTRWKTNKNVPQLEGRTFSAKLYGQMQIQEPRGYSICEGCLALLKTRPLTNKNGKRQVTIQVAPDGITVWDRKTSEPLFSHRMKDITYVWKDVTNDDMCGFVVKQTLVLKDAYDFFGYKIKNNAAKLIEALESLFNENISTLLEPSKDLEAPSEYTNDECVADLINLNETPVSNEQQASPVLPRISGPQQGSESLKGIQWTRFDDSDDQDEPDKPWQSFQTPESPPSAESEMATAYEFPPTPSPFDVPTKSPQAASQLAPQGESNWTNFKNDAAQSQYRLSPTWPCSLTAHSIPSWMEYEKSTINWNAMNSATRVEQSNR